MKKTKMKFDLCPDSVDSTSFHVGIELELKVAGDDCSGHDDDACFQSYRDSIESNGVRSALIDDIGLSRAEADQVEPYFDFDAWVDNRMEGYECSDTSDCSYSNSDADDTRDNMRAELKRLTGNESFKVVSDSSIGTDGDEIDAEVCWNYFASRETLKDNAKIMEFLKNEGAKFDTSCGLHINLNNYLKIPEIEIPTGELAFLFDFVAPSRRTSTYCNKYAMNHEEKYSMIYNQGDRLEFRFFSPTLEAVKLNHYVALANVVYRRLAGQDAKLSKKTTAYFFNKMTMTNGLSPERARKSLDSVNAIIPARSYEIKESEEVISESEFDQMVTEATNPAQVSLPIEMTLHYAAADIELTRLFAERMALVAADNSEDSQENAELG